MAEAVAVITNGGNQVSSGKIIGDKYTGESTRFGFVEMHDDSHLLIANIKLTTAERFARRLVISKARPRTKA
jgi:hypothetical protein